MLLPKFSSNIKNTPKAELNYAPLPSASGKNGSNFMSGPWSDISPRCCLYASTAPCCSAVGGWPDPSARSLSPAQRSAPLLCCRHILARRPSNASPPIGRASLRRRSYSAGLLGTRFPFVTKSATGTKPLKIDAALRSPVARNVLLLYLLTHSCWPGVVRTCTRPWLLLR